MTLKSLNTRYVKLISKIAVMGVRPSAGHCQSAQPDTLVRGGIRVQFAHCRG